MTNLVVPQRSIGHLGTYLPFLNNSKSNSRHCVCYLSQCGFTVFLEVKDRVIQWLTLTPDQPIKMFIQLSPGYLMSCRIHLDQKTLIWIYSVSSALHPVLSWHDSYVYCRGIVKWSNSRNPTKALLKEVYFLYEGEYWQNSLLSMKE